MEECGFDLLLIAGGIVISGLWLIAVSLFYNAVTGFFNPEFWALKQILK